MLQLRTLIALTLPFLVLSFNAMGAPQQDNKRQPNQQITCPQVDSHDVAPLRYQFFTAFQMGFSGYEAPCEMKCLGKESCQQSCQEKKGLELLSKEIHRIKEKNKLENCYAYEKVCYQQCESLGSACKKACEFKPRDGLASTTTD